MRPFVVLLSLLSAMVCLPTPIDSTAWHRDILVGYEARQVNMGEAFDGPVCCTIVRKLHAGHRYRGVLYVHGFNDYFFQREMGERYVDSAYCFYAVDLRRYGRSLRPWQYPFNIRRIDEYFEDIDSALAQMRKDGIRDITLCGHSTGGLTTALYVATRGARCGVTRLVTDSPFLEFNMSGLMRKGVLPMVAAWGALSPNTKIRQDHCDAYAESLLRQYHGEWEYNTDWKMIYSPPVTASWIRAIHGGQKRLMRDGGNITVPVLVIHSSRGLHSCSWSEECDSADIVLDPKMIASRGLRLGRQPVVVAIDSGIHDLILSHKKARDSAYDTIFRFMATH